MYKGLRAGEGDLFTLPSPSLFGQFSLTFLYHAEFEQNELLKRMLFGPNICKPQIFFVPLQSSKMNSARMGCTRQNSSELDSALVGTILAMHLRCTSLAEWITGIMDTIRKTP
jgi:hypothetical protein